MPYNTRRKSLSLESLGIHVPSSSRAHRSPPSLPTPASDDNSQRPVKKIKRSHTVSSTGSASSSPPRKTSIKFLDQRPRSRAAQQTPPPSPGAEDRQNKIDLDGINDDIVVGVIQQIEKTGNRPHLLKELAAVLVTQLQVVESSANPAAIISSRLANYLRRPWTALSPCPLDKTLVGTHPKRVYYFLTTSPHQPIPQSPETAQAIASRIISPSLSSAADEEEADLASRSREQMSPSPEIELSELDFDNGGMSTPFSEHGPSHLATPANISHNHRAAPPPLEHMEREFSDMASTLQRQRSRSQSETAAETKKEPASEPATLPVEIAETEASAARKNSEAAAALFGSPDDSLAASAQMILSSPAAKSQPFPSIVGQKRSLEIDVKTSDDMAWAWEELKSPEHVDLDELDLMFDAY